MKRKARHRQQLRRELDNLDGRSLFGFAAFNNATAPACDRRRAGDARVRQVEAALGTGEATPSASPEAVVRHGPLVAYSVEKLGSRDRVRNAAKTDLSDRSRIDDRDLGKG